MSDVNPTIRARWLSGIHVGANKPRQIVRVQRGLIDRHYAPFRFLDGSSEDFGVIAGHPGSNSEDGKPWHGFWRSTGPWIDVPNVSQVQIDSAFSDDGIGSATIQIENVLFRQVAGLAGLYTVIQRGGLSPTFGFAALGRIAYGGPPNEWYDVLNGGYRVKVWQGYGDAVQPTFTGLIDDTDVKVNPDNVTITARSFGQLLTDSRVFGSNKANNLRSPITFADRMRADGAKRTSAGAVASTSEPGHAPKEVTKTGHQTYWLSHGHSTPDNTEWIEIHLPKGRYEDFMLDPHYDGMECYVSVYARHKGLGHKARFRGDAIDDGWVFAGQGMVPGGNGGFPYVRRIPAVGGHNRGFKHKIGGTLELGDNSVLRLSFRNLGRSTDGQYRAGARILASYTRPLKPGSGTARKQGWILVDDASDVVKWALMWAGFHEWEVESFGARLGATPKVFHQSDFLVDIVKWVEQQGDYVFFMDAPSDADGSIGVPVFRHNGATDDGAKVELRDTQQITGLQTKFTKEPLSYIIRARGREAKSAKETGTVKLGEDLVRRVMATYFPPWSGAHHDVVTGAYDPSFAGRLAGVRKHVVHTDRLLADASDCTMMAIIIAFREALAAWTATVEIPGLPGLTIDDRVSVLDAASGMNTRMWLAQVSSTFTTGENGAYTMSLGGSQLDVSDLQAVAADLAAMQLKVNRD